RSSVMLEPTIEPTSAVLRRQVEQELGGGGEEYGLPGEDCLLSDVLSDHRLAEPLVGDDHEVAGPVFHEFELEGRLDRGSVDRRQPSPIEIGHGLEATKPASPEAALEAPPSAFLVFFVGDMLEDLGRPPALLGRERNEVVEILGGESKPDRGELFR